MGRVGKSKKATDGHGLAALLRPYGIRSSTVRGEEMEPQGQRLLSAVLRGRLFPLPPYSRGFNPSQRAKCRKHWGKRGF